MSTLEIEPPLWLADVLEEIGDLGRLEDNWDSYGARKVDPRCAEFAVSLLRAILATSTPRPSVVPTCRGGVQLEWHRGGIDLEIEIESPARMNVSFEDERQGTQQEFALRGNIRPLVEFMQRLESR